MATSDQKLAELLSNESFTRWIKGTASDPERQRWEDWEREDPSHRELKAEAETFYQMRLELDAAEDVEMQLNSLNQRIDEAEQQKNSTLFSKMQPNQSLRGYRVAVAAAIALLLSVVGVLYLYYPTASTAQNEEPLFTTVEVGYGEKSTLKFSDGSQIRLNAKSSLRYSLEQFSSERVEVWLQGEGYFDVAHNPGGSKREFIVYTADGNVRVLGTKFNVNTRLKKTSVVLEEGRVEVSRRDSLLSTGAAGKVMQPGERAIIDASSSDIVLQKVDVGMFTSWIDGEMEFHDTSLDDIITSIEVTYGVNLDVESPELLKRQISGTIQNPDLQNLLTGLQKILDLQIKQVNEKEFLITQQSIQNE